ncbi:MAG: bifunctional chorismate mutase/prephenate dehydrogenase [Desulfobacterales bacterium]|jgi:chorismate mutase/prephenate dehydrogenase|nr:bifunctional chorismate mutase/prephenate dehydrogenase [Desulfobacterales bacterium]
MEKIPSGNSAICTPSEIPEAAAESLSALRNNIDAIDRQIVSLLAQRQQEVNAVVALKKTHNLPVYHPAREENLISDRRARGIQAGLNPDYLEELFRCIIHQSRVEQTAKIAEKGTRPGATVLIVGGSGGMGRYFTRYFREAGYSVRSMRSTDWPNIEALCDRIDLAIISVPIDVTVSVIEKIAPYLPPDCILTDLTSIKGPPMTAMLAAHTGPVVGLHPLFGPTTSIMDKQIVAVTPGRGMAACQWLIDQFILWGAILVQTTPREHDDIMAIVQALRHFATFTFGKFLWQRRLNLARSLEFSSPIYRLELGMVGRLFAQDAALYAEIIFASRERIELLKAYVASMMDNIEMLEKGGKETFNKEFAKIAEWFGPFSEQAMRESTFLIDKLIERF